MTLDPHQELFRFAALLLGVLRISVLSLVCISAKWAKVSIHHFCREVDPLLLDYDPANGLLALSIPQLLEFHHIGGGLRGKMCKTCANPPLQAPLDLDLLLLNDFLAFKGVSISRCDYLEDLPLLDFQLLDLLVSLESCLRGVVLPLLGLLNHEPWHHILVQKGVSTLAGEGGTLNLCL
jgi:hypothetical protein